MKVHYLCRPLHDSLNFVYATELPPDYYAPGTFCVEASSASGKLSESFKFPARMKERIIETKLTKVNSRTYAVALEELSIKFFFKIISLDKTARYVGGEPNRFEGFRLFRVQPANTHRLEQACLNHDFYFIGFGSSLESQQSYG
ncbi:MULTISPECIES: hypothetical protein [unclassified Pseudomonas]|uniref:hypothetical protein n=1 Tax=unclassified Pseudomonas TaxID=196821 RepID=UPI00257ACF17|nr:MULTISPECIES: hypothetical protein [unclassified Pseudomonas]